jgi:TetR/AcrR family transcriptional regulator, cholesterol catabolism regulator
LCPHFKMEPRDKILKGAQELFFKYGIKNITMDEIARHLSISKKTIYQFFKDKDDMVHSLMIWSLEEDKQRMEYARSSSKNIVEEVFKMMDEMREMFNRFNPIFFYEIAKLYPESWKVFEAFKKGYILKMVETSLKTGQEEGLIRKDIDTKLLSIMRVECVEMGMRGDVFSLDKYKIVDVQIALTEHFLYGVCTLKGHKLINKYKNIDEE